MRPEKIALLKQIREEVTGSEFVILTDYSGITVSQSNELRQKLNGVQARCRVVKNSMLRKVAGEMGCSAVESSLAGPTAIVFGSGDVIEAAKIVRDFGVATKKMPVKRALLTGQVIGPEDVQALADMPSIGIMQGMLVSTIAAPMTQLMGVFKQKLSSIVYVLKAAQEKQEG